MLLQTECVLGRVYEVPHNAWVRARLGCVDGGEGEEGGEGVTGSTSC